MSLPLGKKSRAIENTAKFGVICEGISPPAERWPLPNESQLFHMSNVRRQASAFFGRLRTLHNNYTGVHKATYKP